MSKQSGKSKNKMTGITALYCRLSRDDGTDRESNSISKSKIRIKGRISLPLTHFIKQFLLKACSCIHTRIRVNWRVPLTIHDPVFPK